MATVTFGEASENLSGGIPLAELRSTFGNKHNVPAFAKAYVNGTVIDNENRILADDDKVEFKD